MPLSPGTRLGPYEIESPLGAGGMGEVYRARDSRLDRRVAIKVLNSQLVATSELRARFEREARLISQLQHPHICTLHDVGSANGADFLVMEYLEGESLAERVRKGPLPTRDLLTIAIEVADALERAHRAGIIHRDLKPGNVMLTKSGAKLLDFGLAKPVATLAGGRAADAVFSAALTESSVANSPASLSTAGAVVGTVQYMAPEQVQGLAMDARSDIFSFGVMLYEMATGKRAFSGKTPASVIGQILSVEPPPANTLQPQTPPALDRTIRICLEKDADERFQSAHDLKLQLQSIAEEAAGREASRSGSRPGWTTWTVTAALLLVAIGAAWYFARTPQPPLPMLTATLLAPEKVIFFPAAGVPVLSPDGTKLAFVGMDEKARIMLYVRVLSSTTAQALAGTEDAWFPFWSPDSRALGFFADGKLKRIDAAGGPVVELAETPGVGRGGAWSGNTIVFGTDVNRTLNVVSAAGGPVSAASKLSVETGDIAHQWPFFLPDGKHFLFWSSPKGAVCVGELGSLDHRVLLENASRAIYANGYLLFEREGSLFAQPFSLSKLATEGDAVPIANHIVPGDPVVLGSAIFSVSTNGLLVYQGGGEFAGWPLSWYGRDGKQLGSLGALATYSGPAISPDGKRVAVTIRGQSHQGDIWVFDLARGTRMRLTFDSENNYPAWSNDGKSLFYGNAANGRDHEILYVKPADNSGPQQAVVNDIGIAGWSSVSGDGRYMAFMRLGAPTSFDIWGLELKGDRKPFPVVQTAALEALPSLSPDGKWLAYFSNETGQGEIYITAFPGGGTKWQVSTGSGIEPRWRGDGKELFFSVSDGSIMAADISTTNNSVVVGTPHLLFRASMQPAPLGEFDVSRDGKKFLLNSLNAPGGSTPLTLVTNWTEGLRK